MAADITAQDVIRVSVAVLISAVMIGVLVPILDDLVGTSDDKGPLYDYEGLINIIPMILVVVVIMVAISPILKKNF